MFFLSDLLNKKLNLPDESQALPGRAEPLPTASEHYISHRPLKSPVPEGMQEIYLGMGCFWGVERLFWQKQGVYLTAVGYAGGITPNPTYQETCTGLTGHTETVRVVFDPERITLEDILQMFWENHDPTQGMRQGNDVGTVYRSAIYATSAAQLAAAKRSRDVYQADLVGSRYGKIATEIEMLPIFYYAETEHQQYLAKNPGGYCNMHGTGIACSVEPADAG